MIFRLITIMVIKSTGSITIIVIIIIVVIIITAGLTFTTTFKLLVN